MSAFWRRTAIHAVFSDTRTGLELFSKTLPDTKALSDDSICRAFFHTHGISDTWSLIFPHID
jgi:hypothetical protein